MARSIRPSRPIRLGAATVVAGLALAACGSSSSGGTAPGVSSSSGTSSLAGTTLTLYNAQHEQTTDALIAAFTKATGIKVRVKNDDEDVLTAQIEQEGSHSPADVFFTENSNWLEQLGERGLLSTVAPKTLAEVPAKDSATSGDWLGISARISALIYDPAKIAASQLPTSVLQLADPKYKGKLELAPAETDFWPIVDSIARTKGTAAALAWLRGVKANAGSDDNVPDNETITSDVNGGSATMGLINHYYFYRARAELGASHFHAKLAYFAPGDLGYLEDISGAAILKSSTHQGAAQAFLAFLVSKAGQTILAHSESFEYPIHPGVEANSQLPALSTLHPNGYTPAELGTGLEAKTLMQQVGLL
jgi:iron(III) transport system substrate-binding protein